LTPINAVTGDVVTYWRMMSNGETMECKPPEGNFADYAMSPRDLTELPELRRQTRLLQQAISSINGSISIMQRCGVYTVPEIQSAYAKAINAQNIFSILFERMKNLRIQLAG